MCAALAFEIGKIRIGKVLPFTVAHVHLFKIVDHLPDVKPENGLYLIYRRLVRRHKIIHMLGELIWYFEAYLLQKLSL